MPNTQFFALGLNLQQGFVHTNQKEVCNTVAAIFDRFKRKIIIRPEYSGYEDKIREAVLTVPDQHPYYDVVYEDGFTVDTWCKTLYPSENNPKKES